MAYPIEEKLVIAVASSALFALDEADAVYRKEGVRASSSGFGGEGRFRQIRDFIEANNFYEAEIRLNSIGSAERNAEWFFLKGVVFRARGWYFEAAKYFEAALRMEPENPEYLAAMEEIRGFTASNTRAKKEDAVCNLCCGLLALDCCCECCGGDLISCC